jgi:hypothetical protein
VLYVAMAVWEQNHVAHHLIEIRRPPRLAAGETLVVSGITPETVAAA